MLFRSFVKSLCGVLAIASLLSPVVAQTQRSSFSGLSLDSLQRRFVDQRFGMFLHFNFNTYYAGWAEARQNPKLFNPTKLNCRQWASAAKAAGMKWAVLTCKHHDGFAIWQSTAAQTPPNGQTGYTITQSSVPTMDVADSFTRAFRDTGIWPGLYFSMWDPNNGIPRDTTCHWTAAIKNFVLGEITELLTKYGEIPIFWFDGYSWAMGHNRVPWQQIYDTIHTLQPNCVIVETNGMKELWETDILFVEEPLGNWCPSNNTFAACQAQCIGSDWFWNTSMTSASTMKSVSYIVTQHLKALEPLWCNFLLDVPPNQSGLIDTAAVSLIKQVGQAWSPNTSRPPLPSQLLMIEDPITPVAASATSGANQYYIIDDHNDWTGGPDFQHVWTSSGSLPQYVTLSLGKVYSNVSMLFYLPRRDSTSPTQNITGNILKYKISLSTDSANWSSVQNGTVLGGGTFGTWPANHYIKKVSFTPSSAKFVKLEIDSVYGGTTAIIGELGVGGTRPTTGVRASQPSLHAESGAGWQTIHTATGSAVFNASLAGKMKTVAVYDLSGKLLSTKNIRKNSISLEQDMGVPPGMYIVKVKPMVR